MSSTKRSNLFFMIALISMILGSILVSYISNYYYLPGYVQLLINHYLFLLLPVIIYFKVTKQPIRETLRINRLGMNNFFIVLLISLCSLPIVNFIGSLSQLAFHNYLQDALSSFPKMPWIAWIAILAVTPSITEESVMRGVVLGGYNRISIKKAVLINGFLFGLFHLNFNQFFYAFVLGVIMAYLVYITNSIFSSMLMHFIINGISATGNWYLSTKPTVNIQTVSDYSGNMLLLLLITQLILAVIFGLVLFVLIKKLFKINKNKIVCQTTGSEALYFNVNSNKETTSTKETVLNWPLYVSIGIFVLYYLSVYILPRLLFNK